jgi:hypothetical protein
MLGDIFIELLGGAVVDALTGKKRSLPPSPEGEVNASLGAVAAFLGGLALLMGAISLTFGLLTLRHVEGGPLVLLLAVISGALAFGAFRVGTTALRVTQRNVGLSRFGRGAGVLVLVAAAVSLALGLLGAIRWLI